MQLYMPSHAMKFAPRILAAILLLTAVAGAAESPTTEPTAEPSTRPTLTREQKVDQLVNFLNDEYAQLLKSPDWIERSLAAISLSRLPGTRATDQLIGIANKDTVPAVRIVAWQAVLSRAKFLSDAQYAAWLDVTAKMAAKDIFRGSTRVGLLRVMAINPPTRPAKLCFVSIFAQTNALDPHDIPVLDALADCLAAWQTPDLGEYLFNRLHNLNDAYRAEYILHKAGFDLPWAGEHMDLGSAAMWKLAIDNDQAYLKQSKTDWKVMKAAAPEAWKKLTAQLVPSTDLDAPIDPNDDEWRKETELGRVNPKPLDVVFVVDATGSMQPVLDFLKADIGQIKTALELVSTSPRIGITFYRDQGDTFVTRGLKLTDKLNTLGAFIDTVDAHGGGDRPEAVLDALTDCLKNNPWAWKRDGRRAIVLLTDAPPHPQTQDDCVGIAKACKEHDIRLHVMKVRSNEDQSDLSALDDLAAAAGTEPMWMPLPDRGATRFPLPAKFDGEEFAACRVAYAPPPDSADRQILKRLLVEAINPKFGDRVEPLVDVILALTTQSTIEKRAVFAVPDIDVPGADNGQGGQGGGAGGGGGGARDPQER